MLKKPRLFPEGVTSDGEGLEPRNCLYFSYLVQKRAMR